MNRPALPAAWRSSRPLRWSVAAGYVSSGSYGFILSKRWLYALRPRVAGMGPRKERFLGLRGRGGRSA